MTKKVKDVIEFLKADGWQYLGSKGDHHKFYKPGARRPIIVAGNKNRDIPEGTLHSILREAKMK